MVNSKWLYSFKNTIIELSHKGIKFLPHVTVVSNLDYSEKFLSKRVEKHCKKS